MDTQTVAPPKPAARMSRGLKISVGINIALGFLLCGLGLYAFILNVDLGDAKRRLSKEVETRQQTEAYLVETRNRLNQSLLEIEQLKAQLQYKETDFQATAGIKPAMPVVISFRASFLGKGLVAMLENSSERYLTVVLTVRNPTLASARRFTLKLDPKSSESFGHLEGWQFASGDELALYHDDFNPLKLVVP
ncbi:MAG: hypothetical protein ABL892_06830 [Thiobacillaceae bacterium]